MICKNKVSVFNKYNTSYCLIFTIIYYQKHYFIICLGITTRFINLKIFKKRTGINVACVHYFYVLLSFQEFNFFFSFLKQVMCLLRNVRFPVQSFIPHLPAFINSYYTLYNTFSIMFGYTFFLVLTSLFLRTFQNFVVFFETWYTQKPLTKQFFSFSIKMCPCLIHICKILEEI